MRAGEPGPIAVLDYGIGNLRSAEKALVHVGGRARLVADPEEAAGASGVVLPGVGSFGTCADALRSSGLGRVATQAIESGVPFLGICVGFQLLYEASEESPGTPGLGVFTGTVGRLGPAVRVPQMQWNVVVPRNGEPELLHGLGARPWFYFVHSYAPPVGDETVATCDYGAEVAAAAERENVWAVQFHPEKSGASGLALLSNFVACCARART